MAKTKTKTVPYKVTTAFAAEPGRDWSHSLEVARRCGREFGSSRGYHRVEYYDEIAASCGKKNWEDIPMVERCALDKAFTDAARCEQRKSTLVQSSDSNV